MKTLAIQDLSIANAIRADTLRITEQVGRAGAFWAVEDADGVIEVHLTPEAAAARVAEIAQRLNDPEAPRGATLADLLEIYA